MTIRLIPSYHTMINNQFIYPPILQTLVALGVTLISDSNATKVAKNNSLRTLNEVIYE